MKRWPPELAGNNNARECAQHSCTLLSRLYTSFPRSWITFRLFKEFLKSGVFNLKNEILSFAVCDRIRLNSYIMALVEINFLEPDELSRFPNAYLYLIIQTNDGS